MSHAVCEQFLLLTGRSRMSSFSISSFWFSSIFRKLLTSTLGEKKHESFGHEMNFNRTFNNVAFVFPFFFFGSVWFMCYWVLWHREVTGSTGVCAAEKLNERSLLGRERLRRVTFNSLTCLRLSLSLWPTTGGSRWLCRTRRSSSGCPSRSIWRGQMQRPRYFSTTPDLDVETLSFVM